MPNNFVEEEWSVVIDPKNPDPYWRSASTRRNTHSATRDRVATNREIQPTTEPRRISSVSGNAEETGIEHGLDNFLAESHLYRETQINQYTNARTARTIDPEEAERLVEEQQQERARNDFDEKLSSMTPAERDVFLRFAGLRGRKKENNAVASQ